MKYVVSDIHGKFDSLKIMLDHVKFNENDKLIINGDVIDRGMQSKEVIEFILGHKNQIEFILGNHEILFMSAVQTGLLKNKNIREIYSINSLTGNKMKILESYDYNTNLWFYNGGDNTYKTTPINLLEKFFNYIKDKPSYKFIDNNLIVHAGPNTCVDNYDLTLEELEEHIRNQQEEYLVWDRNFFLTHIAYRNTINYPVNIFIGHNSMLGLNRKPYKVMINGNILVNTDQSNNLDDYENNLGMFCIDTKTYYKLKENRLTELKIKVRDSE